MKQFGEIMFILITAFIAVIINAFILMKLWGWFIASTFSLDRLTLVQAIGLALIVNFLLAKYDPKAKKENTMEQWMKRFTFIIIYASITLLIGWFVSLFY